MKADLPGVEKEDIKVRIHDQTLSISAERKKESDEKKGEFHVYERLYGKVSRSIKLPPSADLESVKASYADGVLTLTVPRIAKDQGGPREVSVE